MHTLSPLPISAQETRKRLTRVRDAAAKVGFGGHVEYRHVFSGTGGAQYAVGPTADRDLLIVYAEAFVRDADREDFSLEAIVAHERGHQLLARHERLKPLLKRDMMLASEEILASLLGSIIAALERDREDLYLQSIKRDTIARYVHHTCGQAIARTTRFTGASIMMGPKKLSGIKRELQTHLAKAPKQLRTWLDRELEKLQSAGTRDPNVAEDLLWVRKTLRGSGRKSGKRKVSSEKQGRQAVR